MPLIFPEERLGALLSGRYRLERILGRGGMGVVFAARDLALGRWVAIKILHEDWTQKRTAAERFGREARAMASVRHPNIVAIFDAGADPRGTPYLVLELLEGVPLSTTIDARAPLSVGDTLRICIPLLDALAALHREGIVHRDVKASNVLLVQTSDGRIAPKLLDFGIAKTTHDETSLTLTGDVVGSPHAMSPEQARGRDEVGSATDVWALAVLAFECLTGSRPFEGTSAEILASLLTGPIPSLAARRPELPRELTTSIDAALARDPDARPTAAALRHRLSTLETDWEEKPMDMSLAIASTISSREPTTEDALIASNPARTRVPRRTAVRVSLVLLIALAAAVTFLRLDRSRAASPSTSAPKERVEAFVAAPPAESPNEANGAAPIDRAAAEKISGEPPQPDVGIRRNIRKSTNPRRPREEAATPHTDTPLRAEPTPANGAPILEWRP